VAYLQRPYAGDADLLALIALVAARPAERIADYPSIADLRELLGVPGAHENTALWEGTGGRLAGFATLRSTNLAFEIAPWVPADHLAPAVIAWAAGRVRQAEQGSSEATALRTSCRDHDAGRVALLGRHGFAREPTYAVHMARSLAVPIPAPQVPEGFRIRHVAGEHEAEALVALHRAAFGTQQMTVAYWLAMMRVPEYDPQLDLIALAPDGTFASYATFQVSEEENRLTGRSEGTVCSVGIHPAFRRQGLAKALVLLGLGRLRARGVETACTGTGSWNVGMQQTFRSAGFHVHSTTIFWEKTIPALGTAPA
jgi:mycothiol synthase